MYLRRCYRQKDGKRHAYWALVESYRTARGPRQGVVAYLGELDEQGWLGVQRAAHLILCGKPTFLIGRPARNGSRKTSAERGWSAAAPSAVAGWV